MIDVSPTSRGEDTLGWPRGEISTSRSRNSGNAASALSLGVSATKAASSRRSFTAAVSVSLVPVCSSIRTSGNVAWKRASTAGRRLAQMLSSAPKRSTPVGDWPETACLASSARRSRLSAYARRDLPFGDSTSRWRSRKNSSCADRTLELLDPRRDVRLHAMQLARRADHAALLGDGLEDHEVREINSRLPAPARAFSFREQSTPIYSLFKKLGRA